MTLFLHSSGTIHPIGEVNIKLAAAKSQGVKEVLVAEGNRHQVFSHFLLDPSFKVTFISSLFELLANALMGPRWVTRYCEPFITSISTNLGDSHS